MALRDIDVKETLTTRPTTIGGLLLFLAVFLFFIDDVIILLLVTAVYPLLGLAIIATIILVWAWRTNRI